jgi:hypothetical protein
MKAALFKTFIYFSLIASVPMTFTSCVSGGSKKSGLALQAFQKKDFECEKKVAFASTISVFQDLGYIIKSADLETGLISASSPTKNINFFGSHMSNTEASAFIEELTPKKSSIRLNFVRVNESSSGYGMKSKYDRPVETVDAYENAFEKIREAIFIRTNSR